MRSCFSILCIEDAVDCAGVAGGSAVEDCAGVCGGNSSCYGCTTPSACNFDANATIFDDSCWSATEGCACSDGEGASVDNCGICDADESNDCMQDCAGTWGGSADIDCTGRCVNIPNTTFKQIRYLLRNIIKYYVN